MPLKSHEKLRQTQYEKKNSEIFTLFPNQFTKENNVMVGRVVFKAQAYELKMTILFFVYFGTPYKLYKSIQFIHKPVFLFWFFPCCCFGFTNKAATTKNRQIIYDLSMLCLGLGCITDGDTIQRCIIWERIPTKKWRRTCF
jgi:hypothetical protein